MAWDRLRQVALWRRRLNLYPLLVFCAVPVFVVVSGLLEHWPALRGPAFVIACWTCFLGLLVVLGLVTARCQSRLAEALGERSGWGLGSLWAISQKATGQLRAAGVRVGFLGASLPETPPADFQPSLDVQADTPTSSTATAQS